MTEEAQTEEDPSIEEILDSIRQIISEDEEGGESPQEDATPEAPVEAAPTAEAAPEPEAEPDPVSEEPLDQSSIDDMDFDAPVVEAAPEPKPEAAPEPKADPEPASEEPLDQSAVDDMDFDAPAAADLEPEPAEEDDDILELTDRVDEEPEADAVPEPEPTPESKPAPEPVAAAASADDDSLLTAGAEAAAFDAISELARKTAIDHNGITLEDIVRGEIKPLLRVWLDKNLPVVIERLVREELERVSKRVLDE